MTKEEAIQKAIKTHEYKSPIEMIFEDVQIQMEDDICKAVQRVDIHIDREELIKALRYDRDQFMRGYAHARWKQEAERERLIGWLAKFARHIDFPENLSDAEASIYWREKMRQQFGWFDISWMAEAMAQGDYESLEKPKGKV